MVQPSASFEDALNAASPMLFPGGMGTELQRRGYKTVLPLWSAQANLDAFDLVAAIHHDYFSAGADIAVTNTFRTTPRTFGKVGRAHQAQEALKRAVAAAREACSKISDRPVFVGGSFAPLEDCYEPDLVPAQNVLEDEHGQQASWLADEGVDFLIPETINHLREAKVMAQAASATGLPFIISFVVREDGCLLSGDPLDEAIHATDKPGRMGVTINCRPIAILDKAFPFLVSLFGGPCGLYANGIGRPDEALGWIFDDSTESLEQYTNAAQGWYSQGARIIGGCCGTTPDYIRALHHAFTVQGKAA